MKIYLTVFIFFIFVPFLLCGCGKKDNGTLQQRDLSKRVIRVVTTTGMIADAVKNVGGSRVMVTALMGPGIDPHLYKASEGDVSRMVKADIIFYNGLHLEGKMVEVFEQMSRRVKTAAVSDEIKRDRLLSPPGYEGTYDPHIWFDVKMWMKAVEHIGDVLMAIDSSHTDTYKKNLHDYLNILSELDEYVIQEANKIKELKRVLITAHDAFSYFGRAYGFEVKGLQGISTAAEAGTADVQNLADFIVERKIPAIFVETSVPPRYIEALQAAVQARGYHVKIGGNLYSDAMGNPGTPEENYIGTVRHNINTIVNALIQ